MKPFNVCNDTQWIRINKMLSFRENLASFSSLNITKNEKRRNKKISLFSVKPILGEDWRRKVARKKIERESEVQMKWNINKQLNPKPSDSIESSWASTLYVQVWPVLCYIYVKEKFSWKAKFLFLPLDPLCIHFQLQPFIYCFIQRRGCD